MSAPDGLAALLGELDGMSADDRAVILGALTRQERDLLARLGRVSESAAQRRTDAVCSPWLAAHIASARQGDPAKTPAVREALLRASGVPARETQGAGRSLAGAFGGLLAARGTAR